MSLESRPTKYGLDTFDKYTNLVIVPTEGCNFRCTYCSLSSRSTTMSLQVLTGLKKYISLHTDFVDKLCIYWIGGEPLLAKKVISEILSLETFKKLGKPSLEIASHLFTNGYFLNREVCEEFVRYGTTYFHVGLDGWKEKHDISKKRQNGGDTFDIIWDNLLRLHRSSLDVKICIWVNQISNDMENLKLLVGNIAREIGKDSRFSICFIPIPCLGSMKNLLEKQDLSTDYQSTRNSLKDITTELGLTVCNSEIERLSSSNTLIIFSNGDIAQFNLPLVTTDNILGNIVEYVPA